MSVSELTPVALAPHLSMQEEFVYHWKAITSFFIDNKGEKMPVEQTNLAPHLEQMLLLLRREEEEGGDGGMYGPCLEYLIQHRLLDTLFSLARTDYPAGMKPTVLSFFTRLLSRIHQPLLAHVNVYRPVQRLIKACGEVRAGPTEIEEIQFLCTVCAKVKTDPYLVNFFLEAPKAPSGTDLPKSHPVTQEPPSDNKLHQDFHLVKTLLNLSHSEDSRVAVKACEGLMLCASLPDPVAAHCLVNRTGFCEDLTSRLVDTYRRLPAEINPLDLEHVQAKWGLEVVTRSEDEQTFAGKRQLVSFLSWLDYCDQLASVANPIVSEALARNIHQQFLVPHFQADLLQMSESGCITATAYMTRCLRTVCSPRLLSELVLFLLGDTRKPEAPDDPGDSLRARLIQRCSGLSEEIALITLQLFDTLLQKDDEHILHNLVLRNLEHRQYIDLLAKRKSYELECNTDACVHPSYNNPSKTDGVNTNTVEVKDGKINVESNTVNQICKEESSKNGSGITKDKREVISESLPEISGRQSDNAESEKESDSSTSSKVESCEIEAKDPEVVISEGCKDAGDSAEGKHKQTSKGESKDVQCKPDDNGAGSETEFSPMSTPQHLQTEVHKVVNCFLTLLPEDLKSSNQTSDSGYDMYLKDAHKQFSSLVDACKSGGYATAQSGNKSEPVPQFYEGAFLRMVLDRLSHLLDQSYPINLQLTSVVSKLALVPHPCLHEFLLEPYLPLRQGTRNLHTVFKKIASEIQSQFSVERDLGVKLYRVRRRLMGQSSSMHSVRQAATKTFERAGAESRLEAIIVFEEFCKELSAIAFVKHHAAVTGES
ncbi:FHF complex subunit HOOK interacting protein 2A-like isoform X2 [Dreissena polymorpha]|uniref:FHF complex subunit HOOK interacting protein 2A-like isoform X2 n=1 Tax=Dreissena polymorpha TaxID=45954 RepID=UPI0022646E15|nr:FHF complex subunit HOOK interacting protein 2A-like isoform X2 [Dreissena polymorpha]